MSGNLDNYILPADRPAVIGVSGGRSSGFMLRHILDAHGGQLPDNARAVFNNTGRERPETLDFLKRIEEEWGVKINWLEYRVNKEAKGGAADPIHVHKVVDYETASRNGEPFEAMIRHRKMLPNTVMRICTSELKISTTNRWARREWGVKEYNSVVGFRGDEPKRVARGQDAQGSSGKLKPPTGEVGRIYPMAMDGVVKADIAAFWAEQSFDLGIPSWQGNCDLCFLKGRSKRLAANRGKPELADWWIRMESLRKNRKFGAPVRRAEIAWFSKDESYEMLKDAALSDLFVDAPVDDEDGGVDCFCTD